MATITETQLPEPLYYTPAQALNVFIAGTVFKQKDKDWYYITTQQHTLVQLNVGYTYTAEGLGKTLLARITNPITLSS